METLDPQGGASLDPRGMIDRIYVGDYCGSLGFREHVYMETLDPWGRAFLKVFFPINDYKSIGAIRALATRVPIQSAFGSGVLIKQILPNHSA